jgi:hypothetical protein
MSTTELVTDIQAAVELARIDASGAIAAADRIRPHLANLAACELRAIATTLGVPSAGRESRAAFAARIVRHAITERAAFHARARVF